MIEERGLPDVYIIRRKYGREWAVFKHGHKRATKVFKTYNEALQLAKSIKKPFIAEHKHISTYIFINGDFRLFRQKITWKVLSSDKEFDGGPINELSKI